jgi:hypothetical protein
MKVQLRITKSGASIYAGTYDIWHAESFGNACADAWRKLRQQQMEKESSIGALIEHVDGGILDQLNGAHISVDKA